MTEIVVVRNSPVGNYEKWSYQKYFGAYTHNGMFILFDSIEVHVLTFGSELWGSMTR